MDVNSRPTLLRLLTMLPPLLYRTWRYRAAHWLPAHLRHHRPFDLATVPRGTPIDIVVIVADHYELLRARTAEEAVEKAHRWCADYEALAGRHRDADGRLPQHTWFYPADYPNPGCLRILSDAVFRNLGEIEFHLHHAFDFHESFAAKLRAGLAFFHQYGAMLTSERRPRARYAYIAGNWALDNGAGNAAMSGCNTELGALRQTGCYADFTFPAFGSPAQPRKTNAIYYATDGPEPKSYDNGTDVAAGTPPSGDLMIFQGPLVVDWRTGGFEYAALEHFLPPSPERLAPWLRANVHVQGRPEWVFVKLHTHAIQSREAFLGPAFDATLEAMDKVWNRPPFRLHYATAREAYNMVKAAEAGCEGNPHDYRDFLIAPPANRHLRCTAPWQLLTYSEDRIAVRLLDNEWKRLEFARGPLRSAQGRLRQLDAFLRDGRLEALQIEGEGVLEVITASGPDETPRRDRLDLGSLCRAFIPWADGGDGGPSRVPVAFAARG